MVVQLNNLQSDCTFGLKPRGAGVYRTNLSALGNGLYSTLSVCSIDPGATVSVRYLDRTPAGNGCSEEKVVGTHTLVTDSVALPYYESVCIPKFHSDVTIEATVAGGDATFGMYTSAKDISVLETLINNGALPVTFDAGTPYFIEDEKDSDPTPTSVEIFNFVVPGGTTRNLTKAIGTCCEPGVFSVVRDSDSKILAKFATSPSVHSYSYSFAPARPISAGETIRVFFDATEDNPITKAFAAIMATDTI